MRPDDSIDDLDTRIELAEQRLVARQVRLRSQLTQLGDEVRESLHPQRLLAPAAAGAGTLLSLWWWLARRRRASRLALGWRSGPPNWQGVAAGATGLPWVKMLGLAGPLLSMTRKYLVPWLASRVPARARARVLANATANASATAAELVPVRPPALAPPRAGSASATPAASTGAAAGLAFAEDRVSLDPKRWSGRWLEKAATPVRRASQTPAAADVHYLLRPDGGYVVVRRSIDTHGRQRTVRGVAQPVAGSDGARMRISLWPDWLRVLPVSWDAHQVLHVDEDYAAALVSPRGGRSLSLLVRDVDLPADRLQALLRIARERGYPVDDLRFAGTVPDRN